MLNGMIVDSLIGKTEVDHNGSPVGVVRMDPEQSYSEIGLLLQKFINQEDTEAWETIKSKIDFTFRSLDHALLPLEK